MNLAADMLKSQTREGILWREEGEAVRCLACAHRCLIRLGKSGICKVRWNHAGKLFVPNGYVVGLHPDPIEKKPFFHVLPGSIAMTFGMLGCNFHCDFCQNWFTSQYARDPRSLRAVESARLMSAEEVVKEALAYGAKSVVSSYNEPFITAEWAAEIFDVARQKGLRTGMVSNGYATVEALDYLTPRLDALKIDLKCFSDPGYRSLGGVMAHVLETIHAAVARGIWVEIVSLIIPGFNDSERELYQMASAVAAVSVDIPWHVTAYHPDYESDAPATPAQTLIKAAEIGIEAGLRYVYAGNLPGRVNSYENTHCPACGKVIVERTGFRTRVVGIKDGLCVHCGARIPGIW